MLRPLISGLAAAALALAPGHAASIAYPFTVPDGAAASLEVAVPVEHRGRVSAVASWEGGRILAFRLIGPGDVGVAARRSGPSPQRLAADSDDRSIAEGSAWIIQIRANAAGGGVDGVVVVDVPDAPEIVAAREAAAVPPPPIEPERDPWTLPALAPSGSPPEVVRLFEGTDSLRAAVFGEDGDAAPDGCGWQVSLVRWVWERRQAIVESGAALDGPTTRWLARTASAIRGVDRLRLSDDPLIVGPVPETSLRRRAWVAARRERMRPLEKQLDGLAELSRDPEIGDLADEPWVARMIACLTACERDFDQRHAPEGSPPGADLAASQWDRFLAAAAAFEAMIGGREAIPDP